VKKTKIALLCKFPKMDEGYNHRTGKNSSNLVTLKGPDHDCGDNGSIYQRFSVARLFFRFFVHLPLISPT
jgi:ribosomal protein S14